METANANGTTAGDATRPSESTAAEGSVLDAELLRSFDVVRVLSESTATNSIYILGRIRRIASQIASRANDGPAEDELAPRPDSGGGVGVEVDGDPDSDAGRLAIVHLQRGSIPSDKVGEVVRSLRGWSTFLENQPYFSAHARLSPSLADLIPDLVVKLIYPATETHIRKYTAQERVMVSETPEMYERVVVPYMESFPPSRVEWVYNILDGIKEADRVLHVDKDPQTGFVIVPDLKWDQTSMNALYLTVIVQTRSIRSLRDLTTAHIPLLTKIRDTTQQVVKDRFDVDKGKLRLFVHYQPSYYHFHVHVVHIQHEGLAGMTVGQAHLLDDLISLLELSPKAPEPSLLARMTFTYAIGVEHKLYPGLIAAQGDEELAASTEGERESKKRKLDGQGDPPSSVV